MFGAFGTTTFKPPATTFGGGGGLFGQTPTNPTQPSFGGGGGFFGQGTQPTNPGGFGQTQPTQTTSLFGAPTTTTSTFGGFGGQTGQTATNTFTSSLLPSNPSNPFGTTTSTATTPGFGGFGTTATAPTSQFGSLLGGTTPSTPGGGGGFGLLGGGTPFGQTQTQSTPGGGGIFGGGTTLGGGMGGQPIQGTPVPYQQTTLDGNTYVSISAMDQYSNKSFEELRYEDIKNNRYQGKSSAGPTNNLLSQPSTVGGLFGGTTNPTQTSGGLFGGATAPTSPFGQTTSGLFSGGGATGQTQAGGLFGQQTQPTQTGGLFSGQSQTTGLGGGLFSGSTQQPQQTTGLFGQQPTQQPQQTTGLFGQQPSQQTTGGLFGQQTQTQPQQTSIFGGQPTTTTTGLFGQQPAQQTTGGLFGQQTQTQQPTTTGLFGQQPTSTTTGGLFGQTPTTFGTTLGGTQPQTSTLGGGLFGGQTQAQPQSSIFGATATQPQASALSGGLFGGQTQAQPQTSTLGGLFGTGGATQQPQTLSLGSGLFGTATQQPSTTATTSLLGGGTTGLFGQTQQTQQPQTSTLGGGLFSQTQQPTATTTGLGGLFGTSATTSTTPTSLGGGLFSQTQQTQPTLSLGGLGSQTSSLSQTQPTFQLQSQPTLSLGGLGGQSSLAQPQQQQQLQPQQLQQAQQQQVVNSGVTGNTYGTPYQPLPDLNPLKNLVRSVTQTSPTSFSISNFNNSSLSSTSSSSILSSQRATQPTYLPKSTTKLTLKKHFGLDSDSQNGLESGSSFQSTNTESKGLFSGMQFISKYQKNLNINTSDLTEEKLNPKQQKSQQQQQSSSTIGVNRDVQSLFNNNNNQQSSRSNNGLSNLSSFIDNQANQTQQQNQHQPTSTTVTNNSTTVMPQINPKAPRLNDSKAFTSITPSLKSLETKSDSQLSKVSDFKVSVDGLGSITYIEPVDLRNAVLDSIITFSDQQVSVYDENDPNKPQYGSGLNQKAIISLEKCYPTKTDPESFEKYVMRLKKANQKSGSTFMNYRKETGTWIFQVEHFSKYGLIDDDEEDEEMSEQQQQQQQKQTVPTTTTTTTSPATKQTSRTTPLKNSNNNNQQVRSKYSVPLDIDSDSDLENSSISNNHNNEDSDAPQKKIKQLFMKSALPTTSRTGLFRMDQSSTVQPQTQQYRSSSVDENPSKIARTNFQSNRIIPQILPQPKPFIQQPQPIKNKAILTNQIVPEVNPFSKLTVNNTIFNVFVPKANSITQKYEIEMKSPIYDESLNMRRSFRVSFSNSGKFSCLSGIKLNTIEIFQVPVNTNSNTTNTINSNNRINEFLKNHISNSSLIPEKDRKMGWFTLSHVQDQIKSQLLLNNHSDYYIQIWSLVLSLWGDLDASKFSDEMLRKLNLNNWLKITSESIIANELKSVNNNNSNSYLETIFMNLTAKRITKACEIANANKDYRLSTIISQIWSNPIGKEYLAEQIKYNQENSIGKFIDPKRNEILELLSGDVDMVYKNINDWIRSFAINYWFKFPLTGISKLSDVMESFDESYQTNKSIAPLPPYLSNSINRYQPKEIEYYDISYLLLNLFIYGDRGEKRFEVFENLFHPGNVGRDQLDYFIPWSLYSVLTSIPSLNSLPEIKKQSTLHISFALQLEIMGNWKWAVYVLLHIKNLSAGFVEYSIKSLISRYSHKITDSDRKFLTENLHIPEIWLDEVYSWYLNYSSSSFITIDGSQSSIQQHQNEMERIQYLMKSKQHSQIHEIILENYAPNSIIQSDFDELKQLLSKLLPYSSTISNWKYGGSIFLEYIEISSKTREYLHSLTNRNSINFTSTIQHLGDMSLKIDSFSSQISQIPTRTSKFSDDYKVCLKEISKYLLQLKISIMQLQKITKSPSDTSIEFINNLNLTEENRSLFIDPISEQIQFNLLNSIY